MLCTSNNKREKYMDDRRFDVEKEKNKMEVKRDG